MEAVGRIYAQKINRTRIYIEIPRVIETMLSYKH